MKALVKDKPQRGASLMDLPVPGIGPDDVLVRVKAAAICGTDIHIYQWNAYAAARLKLPMVFGHEYAGEVVAAGANVRHLAKGDRVAAETHVPCRHCYQCATGLQHVCKEMKILGVHLPGAFSEYAVLPAVCAWKLPPAIPDELGAVMEPFTIGVHALSKVKPAGRKVVVFGCGPIGVYAQMVARVSGAELVIGVDVSPYRLELARKMGANHAVNGAQSDVLAEIERLTRGEGADVAVELTGNKAVVNQAAGCLRRGGELVLAGLFSGPVEVDLVTNVIYKEATVYGITGRIMWDNWYQAQALLLSGRLDPQPVTTHFFPLEEADAAFRLAESGQCGKIVFRL